jgi:hypothetical protein
VPTDVPRFLRDLAARAPGPAEIVAITGGDLSLELARPGGSEPSASILVFAGHEVFSLDLAGGYQTTQTAYTLEDQIEVLEDLFDIGCRFVGGGFTEHLWERDGQVVFRELHADDSTRAFLTSGGLGGRLRRRLGRGIRHRKIAGGSA